MTPMRPSTMHDACQTFWASRERIWVGAAPAHACGIYSDCKEDQIISEARDEGCSVLGGGSSEDEDRGRHATIR